MYTASLQPYESATPKKCIIAPMMIKGRNIILRIIVYNGGIPFCLFSGHLYQGMFFLDFIFLCIMFSISIGIRPPYFIGGGYFKDYFYN